MVVSSPCDASYAESTTTCAKSATAYAKSAAASAERASGVCDRAAIIVELGAAVAPTDAHAKILQATLESSMQPTYEKEAEAMDDLLPHEIVERELELQEVAETEERFVEELHVDKDEVEKSLSTEESVVDY
ncbi:DNA-directed RNA polymerase II subunit RPB1 [Hordeum vulgare]|nr:DNA-directed RNA polymerase II subunit RPB1 [Hordeum vulgare]